MISLLCLLAVGGLTAAGCQDQYTAEQLLWRANRDFLMVRRHPTLAAASDVDLAVKAYQRVVETCPATQEAPKALMVIASLRFDRGQFAEARDTYALMVRQYGQYQDMAARAQFMVGQTHEQQGKWADAVQAYDTLFLNYPLTIQTMKAYLHVADGWRHRNAPVQAEKGYRRAIQAYQDAVKAARTPELVSQLYHWTALCHEKLGEWPQAVETYQMIAKQFPDTSKAPVALFVLGGIYRGHLKDPELAEQMFQQLMERYPDHLLSRVARSELRAVHELRATE